MPCVSEYPELTFEILKIIIGFNKKNDIEKILLILSKSNCFLFTICEFSIIIFHMENYLEENNLTFHFMNFFQIFILEYLTSDKLILSQRLCESWDENKWGYENKTEMAGFYKNELFEHMKQYCEVFIDSPAKIVTNYCQENIIGTPLKYIINVLNHLEFEIKLWIERNSTPSSTYISYSELEFIANKILNAFLIKNKIGENSLFIFAINLRLKYAPIFLAKYLNIINKNNDEDNGTVIMSNYFELLCNQQQDMLNAHGFSDLLSYHQENYLEKSIAISKINDCTPNLKDYSTLSAHKYHLSIIFFNSLEKSIDSLKNKNDKEIVQDRNSVTKTRSDEKMREILNGECSNKSDGKNKDYSTCVNLENDKFKNSEENSSEIMSGKQEEALNKKAQKRKHDSNSGNERASKPSGSKKIRKSPPCEPKEKISEFEINPINQELKIAELKSFFDNWNFMYLFNENAMSFVFDACKLNNKFHKILIEILNNSRRIDNLNELVSSEIALFLIQSKQEFFLEKCSLEKLHHKILLDILNFFNNSQKIPTFPCFPQLYWLSKKELDSRPFILRKFWSSAPK